MKFNISKPLNGKNYPTWKVQCRMALIKDSLWGIVSGTDEAPPEEQADARKKYMTRRDRALAIIVLAVDPSLLYLLREPEDPRAVWRKLEEQFQRRTWSNKLQLRRKLYGLKLKEGGSVNEHIKRCLLFCGTERNGTPGSAKYLFCGTHQNGPKTASQLSGYYIEMYP